ncbi:MAG: glutamate--tRNA ligase, partial [Planctomycetota bacterium]
MSVRVRFAPSPTGRLHVGGARCALFNYLYARMTGGVFILRIEDTDQKRSSKVYLEDILDGLRWLGVDWDEGPYFQSESLKQYRTAAQRLIDEGRAYPDPKGSPAIYFRVEPVEVKWNDLIHGEISFDNALLEDFVIIKSDGTPTYNFACVVDDLRHRITCVIRGDDHISNTPKQLALYAALGERPPKFAHIPLILGRDKKRLSKRHGAKAVLEYRDEGILPDALFNFLALLSWSPGGDREIMTRKEIIKKFSLKRVKKTPAIFDYEKLLWMNQQYIKALDEERLAALLVEYLPDTVKARGKDFISGLARLYRVRIKKLSEIVEAADFLITEKVRYDAEAMRRFVADGEKRKMLADVAALLERLGRWEHKEIEKVVRGYAKEQGFEAKDVIHP